MNKKIGGLLLLFFMCVNVNAHKIHIHNSSNNKVYFVLDVLKRISGSGSFMQGNPITVHLESNEKYILRVNFGDTQLEKIRWYFEESNGKPLSNLHCVDFVGRLACINSFSQRHTAITFDDNAIHLHIWGACSHDESQGATTDITQNNQDVICAPLVRNPDGSVYFDIKR